MSDDAIDRLGDAINAMCGDQMDNYITISKSQWMQFQDLRTQLDAAKVEGEKLKDENDEFKRLLDGDGAKTRTVDAVEWYATAQYQHRQRVRISEELAAAQKTIEANRRAMEWALKALRSINGWLDSAYPSLREAREQNYAARHTLTAALAATDGGV